MYDLPFPDASFDAALAHTVVEHLGDPLAAFREVRRVLKPGAVFGVRDPDYSTARYTPDTEENQKQMGLIGRVQEMSGGSPYYAPNQRALLLRAGFSRAEAGADVIALGSPEATPALAFIAEGLIREPAFVENAEKCGVDREALDAMLADIRAWSTGPDSFWALMLCHAVAWA